MRQILRIIKEQRSRPRSRSSVAHKVLESIVKIASKHDLDSTRLLDAFYEALENGISRCGGLTISCRKVNQDSATFLIVEEERVVWQFPINLEIMNSSDLRARIKQIPIPKKFKKTDGFDRNLNIDELSFGMKRVNITAEIVDIPPSRLVNTKWGAQALVSNAKIADETGTIRVGLWNNRIKTVRVGDMVEIKNCSVRSFRNEPQLRIPRKGTLSVMPALQQIG